MQTSVKIVRKFSEGLVSSTFTFGHLIVTSGDSKASSKRQGMFDFILYATFLFFFGISSLLKACSFSVSIIVKWVPVFQEGMVKMIVAGEAFLTHHTSPGADLPFLLRVAFDPERRGDAWWLVGGILGQVVFVHVVNSTYSSLRVWFWKMDTTPIINIFDKKPSNLGATLISRNLGKENCPFQRVCQAIRGQFQPMQPRHLSAQVWIWCCRFNGRYPGIPCACTVFLCIILLPSHDLCNLDVQILEMVWQMKCSQRCVDIPTVTGTIVYVRMHEG